MIPYLQKLNNASQQYETLKNQYDELDESAAKVQAQLDELVTVSYTHLDVYKRQDKT